MMHRALSLFSGVGGLDVAFRAAGAYVSHMVEADEFCCKVLRKNFPHSVIINDKVENVHFPAGSADIVFGGPPCQGFSVAGQRAGFADERYLWPAMFRIVSEVRPRAVLVENVRGSITGDSNLADAVLGDLESIGYAGASFLVPACLSGAPHERYRVFIVAYAVEQRHGRTAAVADDGQDEERHIQAYQPAMHTKPGAYRSNGADVGHRQRARLATRKCVPVNTGQKFAPAQRSDHSLGNPDRFYCEAVRGVRLKRSLSRRRTLQSEGANSYGRVSVYQPRLGRATDGTAPWLHFPGWPAGQGSFQYPYEPARAKTARDEDDRNRIEALGNAVVWQQAYPLARAICEWLTQVKRAEAKSG